MTSRLTEINVAAHGITAADRMMQLDVDDDHYILVFIWDTIEKLQKVKGAEDAGGYWCSPEIHIKDEKVVNERVSDLHFYRNGLGGGSFAHELQHFIQFWIEIDGISTENPENVPKLAGDMTNKFWVWFYDCYQAT